MECSLAYLWKPSSLLECLAIFVGATNTHQDSPALYQIFPSSWFLQRIICLHLLHQDYGSTDQPLRHHQAYIWFQNHRLCHWLCLSFGSQDHWYPSWLLPSYVGELRCLHRICRQDRCMVTILLRWWWHQVSFELCHRNSIQSSQVCSLRAASNRRHFYHSNSLG